MRLSRSRFNILFVTFVVCFLLFSQVHGNTEKEGKQRRKKRKTSADATSIFSGASPSGATKWKSDSAETIYTTIDTSHLKFDRAPRYLCSVVIDSRSKYLSNPNGTLSLEELQAQSILANVTGKTTPLKPSASGFRVRLRFKPEVGRNLTESVARLGGWRVRWVAITDSHSLIESARSDVKSKRFEGSLDEKPAGQYLVYVKMLEALAKEELPFVQGIVGNDYELPLSKRPKPKPKEEKTSTKNKTKTESKSDQPKSKEDNSNQKDSKEDKAPKEPEAEQEEPTSSDSTDQEDSKQSGSENAEADGEDEKRSSEASSSEDVERNDNTESDQ